MTRSSTNTIETIGDVTAIIIRKRDGCEFKALVDAADTALVERYSWSILKPTKSTILYAGTRIREGRGGYVLLHRFLLSPPADKQVDHINHNGLDNRRSNLRVVTRSGNLLNRAGAAKHGASQLRGVALRSDTGRWRARITIQGKERSLGCFRTKEAALSAHREALRTLTID